MCKEHPDSECCFGGIICQDGCRDTECTYYCPVDGTDDGVCNQANSRIEYLIAWLDYIQEYDDGSMS